VADREARGGTLVVGGGFAGGYVARCLGKRGATIVSPENSMLYTPLLPEAASGTLEPRHVVVPLRVMCPYAELVLGRARSIDFERNRVNVETFEGVVNLTYHDVVIALGAISRALPIPGLADHALGFKSLADAIHLRNHVLRRLEAADAAPDETHRLRELTFVFVGAGYAGVEALGELSDLVRDALRYYPKLQHVPQRWVLVDAAPKILPEIPRRLGEYAAEKLAKRGVEIHVGTTLESVEADSAQLSNGDRVLTHTLVWTAGVRAHPLLSQFGLPLDDRGRVIVDETLAVEGHERAWALGDGARVPNLATPGQFAHLPARPAPGPAAGQEPPGRAEAVPLPHARPGGNTRALQGHRRRGGPAPDRLPRLVRHPHVPPLPAAPDLTEAARRRRLDDLALLPP
jgi:NADH:ubiquinone reductase (H+-translocating)